MSKHLLLLMIIMQLTAANIYASESNDTSPSPLKGFWTNTVKSHTGWNSLWHLGAVGATGAMILAPIDQHIVEAEKNIMGETYNRGALMLGNLWHILPAAIVYWTTDTPEYKYASGAVVQATGITFLVSTTEKFIFGRPFIAKDNDKIPDYLPIKKSTDARAFYPFQNLAGMWPSGHTSTAFAAASALTAFYRDEESFRKFAVLAYTASALMGFAMIDGNFHWASDVVAGALIGHAIGWTVGSDFRARYRGSSAKAAQERPSFIPLAFDGNYGFQIRVPL